jgi:hypothetical protein
VRATVQELAGALQQLKRRYNAEWLIELLGFRTPARVPSGFSGATTAVV